MSIFNLSVINEFISGEERTVRIKKNIIALAAIKGLSVVITFLLVSLTLSYLNPVRYGIWLTLSSILTWMIYFDFGLGNGLRNKLAETLAQGDIKSAKAYISTAYFLIALVLALLLICFFICNMFLNWSVILNAPGTMSDELNLLAGIVFVFYGIRFISTLIETILIADQKPAIANTIELTGTVLSLILTYMVVKMTQESLVLLGIVLSGSIAIVPAAASLILFKNRYTNIAPSWKYFNKKYLKQLINLGIKFFILQIGALITFSTSSLIITQLFNPAEVVPYNIAFKYFNIPIVVFTIILMPLWSAYTEAYIQNDILWIKKSIRKLIKIWLFILLGVFLMIAISEYFYRFWIGDVVHVPFIISIIMGIYVIETTWCNIFVSFINGIGKIQLQMWTSITIGILVIPLSILLGSYCSMGVAGVILAPCLLLFPLCILWPVQVKKILSKKANGIWNK